jgi:transposase-like protein
MSEEIKRWTAKRRTHLVLQIIRGETTAQKAAREHGLKVQQVQHWYDEFLSGGENSLRSKPREEAARKEQEIRKLKEKIGDLVMDIEILKEAERIYPTLGNFSDE